MDPTHDDLTDRISHPFAEELERVPPPFDLDFRRFDQGHVPAPDQLVLFAGQLDDGTWAFALGGARMLMGNLRVSKQGAIEPFHLPLDRRIDGRPVTGAQPPQPVLWAYLPLDPESLTNE